MRGDGKADPVIFRPSSATWFVLRSSGGTTIQQFGANGDALVPTDYDGDGKADLAVWRPTDKNWYAAGSGGGFSITQFGSEGDTPVATAAVKESGGFSVP
ncbi:MAG TPA: VCBS repeat-containing protein [Pyrinomonadaceae bacterium]|nr:VCBS repeat-containing protein [Pyrinomonadaceae bacterium]